MKHGHAKPIDNATAPLDRRPDAQNFQIDNLLAKVRSGEVRVPTFQRPLNWKRSDKAALFDSIYRGYPVGTLLLWKRAAQADRVRLGDLELDAPARPEALWLVDGQQRVSTLAEALLRKPAADEQQLSFDLSTRKFAWTRGVSMGSVPLGEVLDAAELGEWVVEAGLDKAMRQIAFDLGKRVREYQVPAYVVRDPDEDVLRTIFHRVNATGRKLSEEDVFHALFGDKAKPKKPASLRAVARRSERVGFGALAESDALNALKAVNDLPIDRDVSATLEAKSSADALGKTSRALTRAVAFLRQDAGIPHVALLPYALPLAVLSRFFHHFRAALTRNRILLRRWLWRGSIRGTLTGATVGMRQHLACVVPGEEDASVQRLLVLAGLDPDPDALDVSTFNFRTARTKLHCCALLSLAPRDLDSGEPIDVAAVLSADERREVLPRVVSDEVDGVAGLANRLLHAHVSPLALRGKLAAAPRPTRQSHGVSDEAADALKAGDDARFLSLRAATLRPVVERVLGSHAEWGALDTPPLREDEDADG